MSRSYKRFPHIRAYYGKSGKYGRNRANRKIRRLPIEYDIPNGNQFKKLYERCEIWDYGFTQFKEWEIKQWEKEESFIANGIYSWRNEFHTTLEETLVDWKKDYVCK